MPDEANQTKSESKARSHSRFSPSKIKRHFNKKSLIYLACAVISIISIVVIVIVIVSSLNKEPISEEYFVSDNTKSVISLDSSTGGEGGSSSKTHIVYLHEGDEITGLKTYFEYATPEAAQAALESIKSNPDFTNAEVVGRYIIVTSDASKFEGLTVSDVKQQAAAIKQMQDANKAAQEQEGQSEESTEEPVEESEQPQE